MKLHKKVIEDITATVFANISHFDDFDSVQFKKDLKNVNLIPKGDSQSILIDVKDIL